jgi:hypothetical protein
VWEVGKLFVEGRLGVGRWKEISGRSVLCMTGGFQMNYRDELDEAADTPRARAAGTLRCEAMVAPGDNQGDRPTRLPSRSKGCPDYPELAASEWQDFLFVGTYRSERFVLKLVDIVSIDVGQSHAQALTILKIPKLKRP